MQPDPKIFLPAARREILKILNGGDALNAVAKVTLQRVTDALAFLAVRDGDISSQLSRLTAEQDALRARLTADLGAFAVQVTEMAGNHPEAAPSSPIEAFDEGSRAIDAGLRALAGTVGDTPLVAEYYAAAVALETKARVAATGAFAAFSARERDQPPSIDDVGRTPPTAEVLTDYLRQRLRQWPGIVVEEVRPHRGVNSKDILFLTVAGAPGWPRTVVMRRLRAFTVNQRVSMTYEFRLQASLYDDGLPVARPLFLEEGAVLCQPFIIMETLSGDPKTGDALGTGGGVTILQVAAILARIHCLDYRKTARDEELLLSPQERIRDHVEHNYGLWRRSQVEPSATIECAFAWLRRNYNLLSDTSVLVHGDFDLRNLLIENGSISGVLDWERSHVGHPAEDLAYCRTDVEPIMPWTEFLAAYEAHGGPPVSADELGFFSVAVQLFRLVAIARAFYGYRYREHGDFLLGSAIYIEYNRSIELLNQILEKVTQNIAAN